MMLLGLNLVIAVCSASEIFTPAALNPDRSISGVENPLAESIMCKTCSQCCQMCTQEEERHHFKGKSLGNGIWVCYDRNRSVTAHKPGDISVSQNTRAPVPSNSSTPPSTKDISASHPKWVIGAVFVVILTMVILGAVLSMYKKLSNQKRHCNELLIQENDKPVFVLHNPETNNENERKCDDSNVMPVNENYIFDKTEKLSEEQNIDSDTTMASMVGRSTHNVEENLALKGNQTGSLSAMHIPIISVAEYNSQIQQITCEILSEGWTSDFTEVVGREISKYKHDLTMSDEEVARVQAEHVREFQRSAEEVVQLQRCLHHQDVNIRAITLEKALISIHRKRLVDHFKQRG